MMGKWCSRFRLRLFNVVVVWRFFNEITVCVSIIVQLNFDGIQNWLILDVQVLLLLLVSGARWSFDINWFNCQRLAMGGPRFSVNINSSGGCKVLQRYLLVEFIAMRGVPRADSYIHSTIGVTFLKLLKKKVTKNI